MTDEQAPGDERLDQLGDEIDEVRRRADDRPGDPESSMTAAGDRQFTESGAGEGSGEVDDMIVPPG